MKIKLSKIIKYLILSDLVFYSGWGLISPIFAIFIVETIKGGNAFVVGLAAGISLVVRSVFRLVFGIYVDSHKGLKDDYFFLVFGLFISAIVSFGFIFSTLPWHIYVLQAISGLGLAMTTAGFTSIFTRNIDTGKESTEWGIDAIAVGLGPGIAGVIGGAAVTYFNFTDVFIAVGIIGLIGVALLFMIKRDVLSDGSRKGRMFHSREAYRLKRH
jgi:MFS family permease